VNEVRVHYDQHGEGTPVLALHGAGVDHRELMASLEPAFEPLTGYRRIYLDLPGMGRTPAPPSVDSADAVLDVLLSFVDALVGDEPFLVVGHSAGGYYAQAIADRRPAQVLGLALICPLLAGIHDVPEHSVRRRSGEIGDDEFRDYFTVQTPEMLARYDRYVRPGAELADQEALARIGERSLRKWGSLVALTSAYSKKPSELMLTSLVRANFCESIAVRQNLPQHRLDMFLIGLLSSVDAALNTPMAQILEQTCVSDAVRTVLLNDPAAPRDLTRMYALALACERGAWGTVVKASAGLRLTQGDIATVYWQSVHLRPDLTRLP